MPHAHLHFERSSNHSTAPIKLVFNPDKRRVTGLFNVNGRQGDHIFPVVAYERSMCKLFENSTDTTAIAKIIKNTLHPDLVLVLVLNFRYSLITTKYDQMQRKLQNKYHRLYNDLISAYAPFANASATPTIDELNKYIQAHHKAHFSQILGAVERAEPYDPSKSGKEGNERKQAADRLTEYMEKHKVKSFTALLIDMGSSEALCKEGDKTMEIIDILTGLVDADAVARIYILENQSRKYVLASIILEYWNIFESCGLTEVSRYTFLQSLRNNPQLKAGLHDMIGSIIQGRFENQALHLDQCIATLASRLKFPQANTNQPLETLNIFL